MSIATNILNANEAMMFNPASFAAATLCPREESTSAVATRSLQRAPLSASQTTPRHVVQLADDKKSGDMGVFLIILLVLLITPVVMAFFGAIASASTSR